MSQRERPAAATDELSAAFETYTKRELAEMLAHVVKTYVIDGTQPNKMELGIVNFPKHLRDLSFCQLVSHLKMHLDLPELNLLTVAGAEVLVKLAGRDYSLTDPRAVAPQPPPAAPAEDTGGRAPSPAKSAQPAAEEAPAPSPGEIEFSDRFRMLELD